MSPTHAFDTSYFSGSVAKRDEAMDAGKWPVDATLGTPVPIAFPPALLRYVEQPTFDGGVVTYWEPDLPRTNGGTVTGPAPSSVVHPTDGRFRVWLLDGENRVLKKDEWTVAPLSLAAWQHKLNEFRTVP